MDVDAGLWAAYRETVVRIRLPDGRTLAVVPVTAPPDVPSVWPFDAPVAVLTAANPGSRILDEDANATRHGALLAALPPGLPVLPALGQAPDGTHAERSVAVPGLPRTDAAALARRFGQLAFYELDRRARRLITVDLGRRDDQPWAGHLEVPF